MKTITLKLPEIGLSNNRLKTILIVVIMALGWITLPHLLRHADPTVALPDAGIWQLLLFALICFATILAGTWWLLYRFWLQLGLTSVTKMVSQFYRLTLWQQLRFFWACFALLVLAAVACVAAVL